MTFTHALSTNNYGPAKFIVSSSNANGTHNTIASAITAATSGDTIFIRNGTYTENLTLKAGVNLTAWIGDANTPNTTIIGNCTHNTAGTVTISGIELRTNSAACITVSGSVASILNLVDCNINCLNATGISYSSSSASSRIRFFDCIGNMGTTGIKLFDCSASGEIHFQDSWITNTGATTTASTISAGFFVSRFSRFEMPITTSSTATLNQNYSQIDTATQNVTALTVGGSGANSVLHSEYNSGSASGISVSSTLKLSNCSINCTNTNAIAGAGTIENDTLGLPNTGVDIAPTITPTTLRFGTQRSTTQPCFLAYLNTPLANATGDGTVVAPVKFDTVVFDQNSNYSAATGLFTAPVTGRYLFTSSICFTGLAAGHAGGEIDLSTSGLFYHGNRGNYGAMRDNTNTYIATMSAVVFMNQGNTAHMYVSVTGGAKVVNVFGQADGITFLSGHLIC